MTYDAEVEQVTYRSDKAAGPGALRRISEVAPLTCPRCQGLLRIVAVITEPAVITRILAHRVRARDPTPRLRGPLRKGAAH
jgi:hypothetical protein